MKKLLAVSLVLLLSCGIAFSDGLGLTAGFELGITDLEDVGDNLYIMPSIAYENDTLVDGLELSAKLALPFGFNDFWLNIDIELEAAYNLNISSEGALRLSLLSETTITPDGGDYDSTLTPGVKYTHSMSGLSVFGQLEFPIQLLSSTYDPFSEIGLDISLGMNMDMGFGFEVKLPNILYTKGGDPAFFKSISLIPSFETGPLYADCEFRIPSFENFDFFGMTISPYAEYQLMDSLKLYGGVDIGGVGGSGDIGFGLKVGAKFSL